MPIFTYANTVCRDITRNFRFGADVAKNPNLFYPLQVPEGMRADAMAYFYFDDPYLDWEIYHANRIVDPMYGWPLTQYDFNKFIETKYGSQRTAQLRIRNYKLNPTAGYDITPERYNSIPFGWRKYYTPNYGFGSSVVSYKRVDESWTVNTNQILQFNFSNGALQFNTGDLVTISNNAGYPVGNCEVAGVANDTAIFVKNISGNTDANNNVLGGHSNTSLTITDTDTLQINIPLDEFVFWTPVSYYDYEMEKNGENRNILMVNGVAVLEISEEVRAVLNQPNVDG